MYSSIAAGSLLAALTLVSPLQGQQIAADVILRSGPVAGPSLKSFPPCDVDGGAKTAALLHRLLAA